MHTPLVSVAGAVRSQAIRLRRSGIWFPTLGITGVAVGLGGIVLDSAVQTGLAEGSTSALWDQVLQASFGLWTILLLPMLTALVAAQVAAVEHNARGWKHLFALPTWKGAHVVSMWAAVVLLTAGATVLLAVGLTGAGAAVDALRPEAAVPPAPLAQFLRTAAVACASALPLASGHLWLSVRWPGVGVGLGVAVVGVLTNIVFLNLGAGAVTPYGLAPSAMISGQHELAVVGLVVGLVVFAGSVWHLSRRDTPG
ncbi:MAG: ABC transporter permease [Bacteroidota bacterium]